MKVLGNFLFWKDLLCGESARSIHVHGELWIIYHKGDIRAFDQFPADIVPPAELIAGELDLQADVARHTAPGRDDLKTFHLIDMGDQSGKIIDTVDIIDLCIEMTVGSTVFDISLQKWQQCVSGEYDQHSQKRGFIETDTDSQTDGGSGPQAGSSGQAGDLEPVFDENGAHAQKADAGNDQMCIRDRRCCVSIL